MSLSVWINAGDGENQQGLSGWINQSAGTSAVQFVVYEATGSVLWLVARREYVAGDVRIYASRGPRRRTRLSACFLRPFVDGLERTLSAIKET